MTTKENIEAPSPQTTDITQIQPTTGTKLAHVLANGFDDNSNAKTASLQNGNSTLLFMNDQKIQIEGVEEIHLKNLTKYGITLNILNDAKYAADKQALATAIGQRISNTQSVAAKEVSHFATERKLYLMDLNIICQVSIKKKKREKI